MVIARSKVTAQGQVSVPAEVRKRLGVGPGAVIEWDDERGQIVVRRVGRYSSADINLALFPDGPPPRRTIQEMDASIRARSKAKHARR